MINLDNVKKTDKETRLFVNGNNIGVIRWLMEKAGAVDCCVYSGLMVMRGKVRKIETMTKSEIDSEIETMYQNETKEIKEGVKTIPGVIISNYDVTDLYAALRNSAVVSIDTDYLNKVELDNEALEKEMLLNPDTDFGESITIKNSRLGIK